MARVVISGATGAIGIALTQYCLSKKDEVTIISRPSSLRTKKIIHSGAKVIYCDLQDYANFNPEIEADVFFHLAWSKTSASGRNDVFTQYQNIGYTLDAVNLAKKMGCKCFIGAGSQAEYGPVTEDLTSQTPARPLSAYGIAKLAAGQLSRNLCAEYGIKYGWGRILSVYGPHDADTTLIMHLIRTLSQGNLPQLTPCEQIWDYMYSTDAARALYAIYEKGTDGKAYVLGGGKGRPLHEYVKEVASVINPKLVVKFGERDYYPFQPMHLVANLSELTQDTGFTPNIDFETGIKNTIDWYRSEYGGQKEN